MKFDQDLRLNLRYDFGKMNSTLGSVVPLAMFMKSASSFSKEKDFSKISHFAMKRQFETENLGTKIGRLKEKMCNRLYVAILANDL